MTKRGWFTLLFPLLLVAGCGGIGKEKGPVLITSQNLEQLVNREWDLKNMTVAGKSIIMHVDANQTLLFASDGRAVGFGAVNRFSGAYQFSPEGLLSWPTPLITTRMAGPPELMDKERYYLEGLPKTTRAVVSEHSLQLQNDDGSTVLVFLERGY